MARFDLVVDEVLRLEGGFVDDPDDKGGRTIFGISEKANPEWRGWTYIDGMDDKSDINSNVTLREWAIDLYKQKYWDVFELELFPQRYAFEMFDIAVNMGVKTATEFAQRIVNILSSTIELKVDGVFGKLTRDGISAVLASKGQDLFAKLLNVMQGYRYIEIMERDYTQEKFIGWFKRI